MNCCTNETNSPRSMVSVGHFDFDYRYNFNESPASADGHKKNEEDRQDEQMLDVFSIDDCNPYLGETKKKTAQRTREEIIVETVGIHSVDSSACASNGSIRSQGSNNCDSQKSNRQCLGVETKTEHARINFYKSPSHLKEDVEMEFRVPSGVLSHRTSYHTGPESDSAGCLSTDSDRGVDDASSQISIGSTMDRDQAIELLREARQKLSVTKKEWKSTQRERRDSVKGIADLRETAQTAKRELKNFNQDWESQQTLIRNKDKELERLRLIIADRTLQLTEKTGELSITKVALVSSENGLSACRTQVNSRNEDLKRAQKEIDALRKALSDAKAELSRTKLQLEASAERRRQFSNKAMRLLLLGESDSVQGDTAKNSAASTGSSGSKEEAMRTIASPRTLRARAKSWSVGPCKSVDVDKPGVAGAQNAVLNAEEELASPSVDDCQVPYSFSAPSNKTKEIGIQASLTEDESAACRSSDRAVLRPTRSRSKTCDNSKEDSNGTNQKSLGETAEENAETNCAYSINSKYFDSASKASTMDAMKNDDSQTGETAAENAETNCGYSLNSKYFDSASKVSTMDAAKNNATNSVATETEDLSSTFFDSTSKTPSASGSKSKQTFPETSQIQPKAACMGEIVESSDYDTAFQSENDSLRSIETTPSAISHLTDPTITGASDASYITSAVTLLKSHSQQFEEDYIVQQKGNKWRSMLKSIKSKNGEEEAELMSATGSSFDDVSSCNSYHSVTAVVLKKSRVPACSFVVSMFVLLSVASALMAKGDIGISYTDGVLSVSDSRLIAGGASLALILIVQSLWNVLAFGVTRVYNMLSP